MMIAEMSYYTLFSLFIVLLVIAEVFLLFCDHFAIVLIEQFNGLNIFIKCLIFISFSFYSSNPV